MLKPLTPLLAASLFAVIACQPAFEDALESEGLESQFEVDLLLEGKLAQRVPNIFLPQQVGEFQIQAQAGKLTLIARATLQGETVEFNEPVDKVSQVFGAVTYVGRETGITLQDNSDVVFALSGSARDIAIARARGRRDDQGRAERVGSVRQRRGEDRGREDRGEDRGREDRGREDRGEDRGREDRGREDRGEDRGREDRGREDRGEDRGREDRGEDRGREERGEDRGREDRGREDRGEDRGREERGEDRGRDQRADDRGRDQRGRGQRGLEPRSVRDESVVQEFRILRGAELERQLTEARDRRKRSRDAVESRRRSDGRARDIGEAVAFGFPGFAGEPIIEGRPVTPAGVPGGIAPFPLPPQVVVTLPKGVPLEGEFVVNHARNFERTHVITFELNGKLIDTSVRDVLRPLEVVDIFGVDTDRDVIEFPGFEPLGLPEGEPLRGRGLPAITGVPGGIVELPPANEITAIVRADNLTTEGVVAIIKSAVEVKSDTVKAGFQIHPF